jgi:hypothetical protein
MQGAACADATTRGCFLARPHDDSFYICSSFYPVDCFIAPDGVVAHSVLDIAACERTDHNPWIGGLCARPQSSAFGAKNRRISLSPSRAEQCSLSHREQSSIASQPSSNSVALRTVDAVALRSEPPVAVRTVQAVALRTIHAFALRMMHAFALRTIHAFALRTAPPVALRTVQVQPVASRTLIYASLRPVDCSMHAAGVVD